ncbi:uncharacterized protein LOC128865080 [Anastrepha ludens]|uniref:uncharacterized protein LOC128865080 n=1 Tax=Anastrepha ludens TaxID=28586 RepID=UPI0023B11C5A|nr:uncharacterized protein LOC128865080 [Anastrepha ludens]
MFLSLRTRQLQLFARFYQNSECLYIVNRNVTLYKRYSKEIRRGFITYSATTNKNRGILTETLWNKSGTALDDNVSEPIAESESEISNFKFKSLLYDENSDEVISELNSCKDEKQLLRFIKESRHRLNHQHFIQSILVLKDLFHGFRNDDIEELLGEILSGLQPHIQVMSIKEQSCCYLYLRRLEVSNTNAFMRQLLLETLNKIITTSTDNPIALPSLSRLAVGINCGNDFHVPSVCGPFIPHIMFHIQQCNNEEDFRLLSICLINLQSLITIDILEEFKAKLDVLILKGAITEQSPKTILKLLHLLNLPVWSQRNGRHIRELLILLQHNLSKLNISDLKTASRIFGYHLEPAALIDTLSTLMKDLVQIQHKTDVLAAYMPFLETHRRESIEDIFRNLLSSSETWQSSYAAGDCFQIIRSLKISDAKICDAYWSNVLNLLERNPDEKSNLRFLRHCHRYMHFNNNLGGTYRFIPLERRLSELTMQAIENDIDGRLPSKFARLAAFTLAYGHTPFDWKKFPNTLLSKIISMANQFSVMDCFFLSRGIHIALELRFRNNIPAVLKMQLATLDSVLTDCVGRHLENKFLSIFDLNTIVRTLGYRKSLKNASIYHEALERYKHVDYSEINSRTIREMAFNFNASNCTAPIALEAMFTYIEKHHEHVIGDTVEKVLTCAYNLGYTPQSETVLHTAALVLKRDFKHMSGLSIVQACLALSYYKSMPKSLIDMVFCVKFIQRIEEEIHMCYSKATYPERVLNLIMQLNRTICLDYPEANIPWFQQNYLEAQLSKKPKNLSKFGDDVKKLLTAILSNETFFTCNHITPYGYQIDFVIHFDKNRKPIPVPAETTLLGRITKVAILLMRLDSFCKNDLTALRGSEHLRTKHLEMMGYKVIHINEHDWNTRYMNSPHTKSNYLKCLLQI